MSGEEAIVPTLVVVVWLLWSLNRIAAGVTQIGDELTRLRALAERRNR